MCNTFKELSRYYFHPWCPDRRASGKKFVPGCISEAVRCRNLILDRDIGWGVGMQRHGVTLICTSGGQVTYTLQLLMR